MRQRTTKIEDAEEPKKCKRRTSTEVIRDAHAKKFAEVKRFSLRVDRLEKDVAWARSELRDAHRELDRLDLALHGEATSSAAAIDVDANGAPVAMAE